jgi:large repetitive protein
MQRLGKTFSLLLVATAAAALSGCFLQSTPRADFTATPTFDYPPLEVTFNASASTSPNGPIVDYTWDFGDGTTAGGVSVNHTYTEKGVYEVTLTVEDEAGQTAERTKTVEALNRAPVARFTANVYTTGVHQPVWFNAGESYDPDGEIVDYIWDFGDGETGEGEAIDHEYNTANGTGWRPVITLTVVDENDAIDSVSHTVIVVGCDSCGG